MNLGRNDPCHCGSGKKYKHCCLLKEAARNQEPTNLAWKRVRNAIDGLGQKLMDFVMETLGPGAIHQAWAEFSLGASRQFEMGSPHAQVFMPWLFYRWQRPAPNSLPPARAYLGAGRVRDPILREYVESCLESRFSFFEIIECNPGTSIRFRDLLTGQHHEVLERMASQSTQSGDLLYGMLARAQGVCLLEASAPYVFSPADQIDVINLRSKVNKANPADILRDHEEELRDLYWRLTDRILNPRLPTLQNTDGHDLVLQKLVFDIDSPQAAFDALNHLDDEADEAELVKEARRSTGGELVGVVLNWKKKRRGRAQKQAGGTILGRIEIGERRLSVEVNSNERATQFKRIIKRAMGKGARFRAAEVQSATRLLTQVNQQRTSARAAANEELMNSPEVQAHLSAVIARHYESWVTEKIPALGGRTPLAAVHDPDGREMVEALIRDIERRTNQSTQPVDPSVFRNLRARLGLAAPGDQR